MFGVCVVCGVCGVWCVWCEWCVECVVCISYNNVIHKEVLLVCGHEGGGTE